MGDNLESETAFFWRYARRLEQALSNGKQDHEAVSELSALAFGSSCMAIRRKSQALLDSVPELSARRRRKSRKPLSPAPAAPVNQPA